MSDRDRIATLVATAYDHQTFRPTLGEVRRRARGRLRRRLRTFLAALVLLLAGGGTAVALAGGTNPNADCAAQWAAAGRLGAMPSPVLSVGDRPGISVYAEGSTGFDCVHGSHVEEYGGQGSSFIYDRPFGPELAVTGVVWNRSSVVYTGVTLSGTAAVELHFPESNRTYHAVVRGIHFGIEVPTDTVDETPLFSATGTFGVTVVLGPYLHSAPPPGSPEGHCESPYQDAQFLHGIDTTPPPLVIDLTGTDTDGQTTDAAIAASDLTVVLCARGYDEAWYTQDLPTIPPFTVYGTAEYPGAWVLGGRVPTGTSSVTVSMSDGSTIKAAGRRGFWLAADTTAAADGPTPVSVTAVTPGQSYLVNVSG